MRVHNNLLVNIIRIEKPLIRLAILGKGLEFFRIEKLKVYCQSAKGDIHRADIRAVKESKMYPHRSHDDILV